MGFYSCSLLRVKSLKSPEKNRKTKNDTDFIAITGVKCGDTHDS